MEPLKLEANGVVVIIDTNDMLTVKKNGLSITIDADTIVELGRQLELDTARWRASMQQQIKEILSK